MRPIRDYALIGDCHGSALVCRDGSIGWCTFERFDAEPALFALLDQTQGGAFVIEPADGAIRIERSYLRGTNVLETVFVTATGRIAVTDFMALGRRRDAGVHDYVSIDAPHALIRIVRGLEGHVPVRATWRAAGRFVPPGRVNAADSRPSAPSGDMPWQAMAAVLQARFELAPGESRCAALSPRRAFSTEDCARLQDVTTHFWREWITYCRYHGAYRAAIERSALALKLLTYAPSGAIVAAPTTSLPEWIGGERNWDYRFCWIRDACFTLYALSMLGYSGEARRFSDFMNRICGPGTAALQIMYGIEGQTQLDEFTLDGLSGYGGSRPVRVGNGAHGQRQTDVYGEFADWALLNHALGGNQSQAGGSTLDAVAAQALQHAHESEEGIWEMRGPPRHHVLGKVMCWVALDRASRLRGPRPQWTRMMDTLHAQILAEGVEGGALVQAYGSPARDASLLLIPLLDFPIDRALLARTVDTIEAELAQGDFVHRYHSDDGLAGDEGAFLACSFWRVDAMLALGRYTEAVRLFERLLARANDVGLFAEEVDPRDGAFLGNFPQALSHLALVLNAVHIDLYERGGEKMLRGTLADRARRSVGATFGWRALWAAFKDSRRVGRIVSSRASVLPDAFR
jgi:GH15 family glucan-1,4-alpha-glucosidase